MYLHLGQSTVVSLKNVVAILDMENTTVSKNGRNFLEKAQENGEIFNVSDELPKSYVVCEKNKKRLVYISPISSATLFKRTNYIDTIDDRKE